MNEIQVLAIAQEYFEQWQAHAVLHEQGAATRPCPYGCRAHEHPIHVSAEEAVARLVPGRRSVGDVAVIRVQGFISQKPSLWSELFGGTSADLLGRDVRAAMADQSIGAVVLDVDSPGGEVFGVPEAAQAIRAAKGSKPLVAVVNPLAASAAYYLASQADEVVTIPSGITGSIGVFALHVDRSKAIEAAGFSVTRVKYGRRKAEEDSLAPLTEEALAAMQERVDYYGRMFEADVAKGRKTSIETVRKSYGEGAVMTADRAKAAGLVDRIGTLEDVVAELGRGRKPEPAARAYDEAEIRARGALAGLTPQDVVVE